MKRRHLFLVVFITLLFNVMIFLPNSMSASNWTSPTIISDGYQGSSWNNDPSLDPAIISDQTGNLHVVWWDLSDGVWGSDSEIFYVKYNPVIGWSNVTVLSDGYNGSYWNTGSSDGPQIAISLDGVIHVVWTDQSTGWWGGGPSDSEIMYIQYAESLGWSNITVISDDISDWNTGISTVPAMAVDPLGGIHVVWMDDTDGVWGSDLEIFYVNYTQGVGWGTPTLISDGYLGSYWNTGNSAYPSIIADAVGNVHVVWKDSTPGAWGSDDEIMYANYTPAQGWSNATVISDGYGGVFWNTGSSSQPDIASVGTVLHVVWQDTSDGYWGNDTEILYTSYTPGIGWQNASAASDDSTGWNTGSSVTPSIIAENSGAVRAVWDDANRIMYATYTTTLGWSRGSIIISFTDSKSSDPVLASTGSGVCVICVKDPIIGDDDEIVATFSTTSEDGISGFELSFSLLIILIASTLIWLRRSAKKPFLDYVTHQ